MQLFTQQELNALAAVLSRVPMTVPEQVCIQMLVQRLLGFCNLPESEEASEESVKEGTNESL